MIILTNLRLRRLLGRLSDQFKAAFTYVFQRDPQIPATFPHAAFAFTILVILTFLQVKYQGNDQSPFESHPITICVGVISVLIYGFAYGITLSRSYWNIPRWAGDAIRWCMLLTSSLSVATTTSCPFPDSVRPVFFAFYLIIVAGERAYWGYQRFIKERRESNSRMRRCQQFFTNIWRPLARYFTEQRQQILPL